MLSSLPLHLLFNSVIFTNLQANDYVVVPTMENWLHGAAYNTSGFKDIGNALAKSLAAPLEAYRPDLTDTITLADGSVAPRYQNISTADCFSKYNAQYTSEVGNVYLVQSEPTVYRNQTLWKLGVNNTGDFIWYTGIPPGRDRFGRDIYTPQDANTSLPFRSSPDTVPSNGWRCPSHRHATCNAEDQREVPSDRSKWAPYESPVRYCMVEQVQEICKLQFSFLIACIVIGANLVKSTCIAWLLCRYKKHEALVTLGDAIASLLERPDPTTRGRCLQTKLEIETYFRGNNLARIDKGRDLALKPTRWKPMQQRWSMAPSYGTWFATYML